MKISKAASGFRNLRTIAVTVCLVGSAAIQAQAQDSPFGPGLWGANRMVSAPPGTGGIEGTFSNPDSHIGMLHDKAPEEETPAGRNPHLTKPTFFLNLQTSDDRIGVDAGLQWEELASPRTNPPGFYPKGWGIFANVNGVWQPEQRTSIPENGLGDTTLTLKILDHLGAPVDHSGSLDAPLLLTISTTKRGRLPDQGPYFVPWPRDRSGRIRDLDRLTMFRTVGITQVGTDPKLGVKNLLGCWYDGSYMKDLTFRNGKAYDATQDSSGVHLSDYMKADGRTVDPWPFSSEIPSKSWPKAAKETNPFWYRPNAFDHYNIYNASSGHPWPIDFGGGYKLSPTPAPKPNRFGNNPNPTSLAFQTGRMTDEVVNVYLMPGVNSRHIKGNRIRATIR